jgi:hypothetical protein
MRVTSSHTSGDFASGQIDVSLVGTAPTGEPIAARFFFQVPADFRVHNDLVAASLMTILGYAHPVVEFNFPISRRCADLLTHHYGLAQIGPVDDSLEPRRPGRNLGLSYSGGLDSLGLYHFLKRTIPDQVKVIFVEFGGRFQREKDSLLVDPDVCCATNFRSNDIERNGGRFMAAVAILYADYLDLGRITFGHTYDHSHPVSMESLKGGHDPIFVEHDTSFIAASLEEVYLLRSVFWMGAAMISAASAEGDREIEGSLLASSRKDTEKGVRKRLSLRYSYGFRGMPPPPFLDGLRFPTNPSHFGVDYAQDFKWVFLSKHFGTALANRVVAGIDRFDLSEVHRLSLAFYTKYNTSIAELIPASMRNAALAWFHDCGIYPYTERDWDELDTVRRFLHQVHTAPETVQLHFGGWRAKGAPWEHRGAGAGARPRASPERPDCLSAASPAARRGSSS